MKIDYRKWQRVAIERSDKDVKGIFLEALGGRGKTICALGIADHKKAKRVLIINNQTNILQGWEKTIKDFFSDSQTEYLCKTDKWLEIKLNELKELESERSSEKKKYNNNRKMYSKSPNYKRIQSDIKLLRSMLKVDVLILDEWQNICSQQNIDNYKKISRDYTIGLSATPIRKKGLNFYPLEKTIFGEAVPNQKINWTKYHGIMEYDPNTYTKETWKGFRDYEAYVKRLEEQENFMRWETIETIENTSPNNEHDIVVYRPKVEIPRKNLEKLIMLKKYNVVEVDGKFAMSKSVIGRDHFVRYLKQANVAIENNRLVPTDEDSPLLNMLQGLIDRTPHGLLIVGNSKSVINTIYEKNKYRNNVGLLTGDRDINSDNALILLATSQKIGVGIDGLQYRFKTLVSIDPIQNTDSGLYTDYLQLLWRVVGSRQQHDVNVVEVTYVLPK